MSQTTYTGGCQCGAVRYEAELDLSQPVISCNCSMCGRSGTLLTFVPSDRFKLKSGADHLTDYQFNNHIIHHLFCNTCGIKSFARGKGRDGSEQIAVNTRCLDDVDIDTLKVTKFDGKSR
ncbi:MAG TPA: GFA family protein [Polyangia bacterium]|nr:GFA family protein [Polyangia bacterium]